MTSVKISLDVDGGFTLPEPFRLAPNIADGDTLVLALAGEELRLRNEPGETAAGRPRGT